MDLDEIWKRDVHAYIINLVFVYNRSLVSVNLARSLLAFVILGCNDACYLLLEDS